MSTRLAILSVLLVATSAFAHCQLAWPYPLHSPLNPSTPETIRDYSMTSPLVTDGVYPCKGFINNPLSGMSSVEIFYAGSTINYTVAGTATHGGGSCQISMSYDFGTTWSVIFSHVGGCLIDSMTTPITIPPDAPSGEALFSWSWFNLLGNREMYQNCAVVTIANGGSGLTADKYPAPFVANAGVNNCVTIEGTAVVFPNPGASVHYGGTYASTKPTTPAGFTGTNCVGSGATSNRTSSPPSGSSSASIATSVSSANTAPSAAPSTSSPKSISNVTTFATAPTARTTLWTLPSTNSSNTLSVEDTLPSSLMAVSAVQATPKCVRPRKRSISILVAERRYERSVRRRAAAASAADRISV